MKKLFSELHIVGWYWNGQALLSSWEGKTERWEIRNVDPTYIRRMFTSEDRRPYDDVAEIVPFTGTITPDKFVVIAFTDGPAGECA